MAGRRTVAGRDRPSEAGAEFQEGILTSQGDIEQVSASIDRTGAMVLAILCLAMFSGGMNALGLQPFLVDIGEDLGASIPAVGQAVTVTLLVSAMTALLAGPVADHFGHRRLMVGGALILGVSALGSALAFDYAVFMGARLAGGASLALLNGLSLAIAGSYFSGDARRRALSVTIAAMSGTPILGVPLLSLAGDIYGWRWAFGGLGLAGFLLIPFLQRLIPLTLPATHQFTLARLLGAYQPLLRQRAVVAIYVGSFVRAVFWLGITTYFGAFLIERHGLSLQYVGLSYMVGGVGFLLGSLSAGGRIGRLEPRLLFALVTVVAGLFFGLSYIASPGAVVAVALLTVGGYFGAIGWVVLNTMLANESRAGTGTTMSLNTSIFHLGSAAGGATGGALLAAGDYGTLGTVLPGFALAASLIVWWSARHKEPSVSPAPTAARPAHPGERNE